MRKLMRMSAVMLAAATMIAAWAAGAAPRCPDVLRYLKADVEFHQRRFAGHTNALIATVRDNGYVMRWGTAPPRVLFMANTAEALAMAKSDAEFAVWSINQKLPKNWQLPVGPVRTNKRQDGTITIVYAPQNLWPESATRTRAYSNFYFNKVGEIYLAWVLLDYTLFAEERSRVVYLLHEMLHALGRGHVDRDEFPDTIMQHKSRESDMVPLKSLDKAALSAIYSPLVPVGTRAGDLRCDAQGRIRGSR